MMSHTKKYRLGRYTGHWYIDGIRTNVYGNDATHLYIDNETGDKIKAWHDGPVWSIYEREVDVEDEDGSIVDTAYKYALEWDGQFVEFNDFDIWGTEDELLAYMIEVAEEWAANDAAEDEED